MSKNSDVLLLGNGINQAFEGDSWDKLVEKFYFEHSADDALTDVTLTAIKDLPLPMQIIAATGDLVDKAMQEISSKMDTIISAEQKELLGTILKLPFENILTANYTFELEQAAGTGQGFSRYRKVRKQSKDTTRKENRFNLFRYYAPENTDKKIWHIHGDITTPSGVIMGNYYYGKLLHEIQTYVPVFMRRFGFSESHNTALKMQSWVDSFLTGNVYIMGFGMNLNETDIWWLICCKKRNFPQTKVHLYSPGKDLSPEKRAMLRTYGVDIIDTVDFDGNYVRYYYDVVNHIKSQAEKGEN